MKIRWMKILRFLNKFCGIAFLFLWLVLLVIVDFASFPYYVKFAERLQKLESQQGSMKVPAFKDDGSMEMVEYIAVATMPMSHNKYGAPIHFIVYIDKDDVDKYLKYDNKGRYKRRNK